LFVVEMLEWQRADGETLIQVKARRTQARERLPMGKMASPPSCIPDALTPPIQGTDYEICS
jgi:hypothetical protein